MTGAGITLSPAFCDGDQNSVHLGFKSDAQPNVLFSHLMSLGVIWGRKRRRRLMDKFAAAKLCFDLFLCLPEMWVVCLFSFYLHQVYEHLTRFGVELEPKKCTRP